MHYTIYWLEARYDFNDVLLEYVTFHYIKHKLNIISVSCTCEMRIYVS